MALTDDILAKENLLVASALVLAFVTFVIGMIVGGAIIAGGL